MLLYSGSLNVYGQNLSWQDKTWAEFSTLEEAVCKISTIHAVQPIQPNLELKTRPRQLLDYLLIDIVLPACCDIEWYFPFWLVFPDEVHHLHRNWKRRICIVD
jgi:hypothetical protein